MHPKSSDIFSFYYLNNKIVTVTESKFVFLWREFKCDIIQQSR